MLRFILSIAVLGTLSCSKDAPVSPPRAGKAIADNIASDRAALLAFYKATGGDNWKDNTNWLSENSLASWHGVYTDSTGRVRYIDLRDNNLTGSLLSELGQLTELEGLQLSANQLGGTIPSALGQLTKLRRLSLAVNQLGGMIPSELGRLTNLERLDLSFNPLRGTIPSVFGQLTKLTDLGLSGTQLGGTIPSAFGQLTNLVKLELSFNQLTGAIPSALGQLTELRFLYLSGNQLTGAIPSALGQLTKLRRLSLADNQLTGAIPSALGQLTNLEELALHINQLGGTIPSAFGQLTKLGTLELRENQLTGCIPNTLRGFTLSDHFRYADFDQLEILFCGEDDQLDRAALIAFYMATNGPNWKNKTNWLTDAPLDKWHGVDVDVLGRVIAINLNGNGLQGAIPQEIRELTSLKDLRLGHNQLTDATELGNLTGLTVLMLHYNQLGGNLPATGLTSLMLGDTQLRGRLPTFSQRTNLQQFWLQGNQITDVSPLANLTTSSDELSLSLSYNQITDISPLANLTDLRGLWLKDIQITDISPLANLTNLGSLVLTYNRIMDISPLANLTNLEGVGLSYNRIMDISPLANLTNLKTLNIGDNRITDISPLLNLMALEELDLWGNPLNSELQTIHTLEGRGVVVFFSSIVESVFNIELVFLEDFSDSRKRKIGFAAQRWASIFTADLPDYEFSSDWQASCGNQSFEIRKGERIDDLRIYVGFIDSGGWAIGRGWPSLLRDNHLPVVGCMVFSPIGVFGNTYFTGLHEIGHVLGFGTTWTNNGLLHEPSWDFPNGDPHFNGSLAVAAFDEAGGHGYRGAKVPVAGFSPNGEYDNSHWRSYVFGDELMTATGGNKALSAVTLQSLADLGYSVDISQADPHTLPALGAAKPVAAQEQQPFCDMSGISAPVYVSELE